MTPRSIRPWVLSLSYSLRHPWVRWGGIASAALALLLLVVWIADWWPAQREQAGLWRQIDATRRVAVEAARAEELRRAYDNAARTIDAVEKKLNYAASQADLVQQLARLAAAALRKGGFTQVVNLRGGFAAWQQAGLPLQK